MRLKNRTALISGGSRNLGKAIALTFAREGADIILVANKSTDELAETAKEVEALGVRALPLQADVSDSSQVNRMVQQGLDHFGKVDILVCSAGLRPQKPFWEFSDEEWHRVIAVNMYSTFYLARALAPSMMARKSGNIIALGGLSTLTGTSKRAALAASKTGLHGLMRALATELGPYGIRANQVLPGLMDTSRKNPEWYPDGLILSKPGEGAESTPLGRLGHPQDVANACLFLASDESNFVTGDRIICAGGAYM